ncbi:YpiF family protein [Robertmurraya massiliosenegalensis]|uniref:YpiF family protein n=1 Tax=Robertmurraya massiliosenegalensis TaxID=1287657 RepID=UPI0002F1D4C5|nr:YpiF family protein [Robertmurraya massiliosenegalensis]
MKWVSNDIDMYLGAKEYVDTVVLPLLPISFGDDIKQSASMTEFISLLNIPLERQFKGRLMMLPGYPYLKSDSDDRRLQLINHWETEFKKYGFKHIFYITSDSDWRSLEEKLEGTLIWLPSLPLESMDDKYRNQILEDQISQLIHLFVKKWQNND